ncbi:Predicted Zn-dependent protease, minimal metalloprotease (MMP)-like domain [Candidatus Kryptobacter tengchongensis]|uniref:Predicted Zn-dependent protease, minimal metalloprotease (MMP)-like domain n=2 Tax=Kryptobacter tengchongensis TaxID=1643429 RepID=A0A916LKW2_KRYT1|nr:metallopeptidase family protein [Candidatus Kryptobacter tengchongensis]CUS91606.1 Predicted Zn-dependent protease, minimal metalloprotease (MMP)-like domain [Candidatus Kryptobacter tengchongensis]CUT02733.1 Predicted Zn-dependent protease, minimal metalloprotease (MMP)-like domain [Candidatus Kryptobacter tengchongensis]CUU08215.1 Predicted Zn-dependent protease, minimal metalloprotease (MMP)-like domain [Candidatus Kryptobacter tengchongensis]
MTIEEFEEIVKETIENLPELIKQKLDNVVFIVQDYPDEDELKKSKSNKYNLLGLYTGIPLSRRGTNYGMYPAMPDRIFIFKANIERLCKNENELKKKIREVVLHEIGHYLGMSEEEVRRALKER